MPVAASILLVLVIIAFTNYRDGTLGNWLKAKFLNAGDPNRSPAGAGVPIPGVVLHGGEVKGVKLRRPVPGPTISPFGADRDGGARKHQGIDIGGDYGDAVLAAGDGTVIRAGDTGGKCGIRVAINHGNGVETIYCHLARVADDVRVGTRVETLQVPVIGTIGDTGNATGTAPHLHFEVHINGRAVDPDQIVGVG